MDLELKKKIGLYGLTMVAVGSCIGSGIFITPSSIAGHLGQPGWIIGAWLLGGVVALTGSLTFAELGNRFPSAGGVYVYIREAFGHLWAFLYGWCILTVITSGAIAALSLTFARYISTVVPLDQTGMLIVGAASIVAVTLINVLGVKPGEVFSSVFTTLKLAGIAMIVVIGIWLGQAFSVPEETAGAVSGGGMTAFALAMIGVLWSFGGWHHASYLSA
ncbi:MAG: amino acid permease, partial [Saprospiraceae bacterium]|nr:amino acid permease [Saprospiraceae bacterium]